MEIKGLIKDILPNDYPKGSWIDSRNTVISKAVEAPCNEEGFYKVIITNSYFYLADGSTRRKLFPIGVVPVSNNWKIVFSIDAEENPNAARYNRCEIGYIDENENYFTVVNNDKDINNELAFNRYYPITGEAKINFAGEVICAFTDNNTTPKLININQERIKLTFDITDIMMFPDMTNYEVITSVIENGGNLTSGTYLVSAKYVFNDLSSTSYGVISSPSYIIADSTSLGYNNIGGVAPNSATSKQIQADFVNLDTRYDFLQVSVIAVNNNITTAHEVSLIPIISATRTVLITGQEDWTDILPIEIQTDKTVFTTIKALTQIDKSLYGANLSEPARIKFQKFALNIDLQWTAESVTIAYTKLTANLNKRTFMPDEVYAFYAALRFPNGQLSELFHIPNRPVIGVADSGLVENDFINTGGGRTPNYKDDATAGFYNNNFLKYDKDIDDDIRYFHTRCTSTYQSTTARVATGKFSYWENQNDLYPDTTAELGYKEYDGSVDYNRVAIAGGLNLTGLKIRHHKFPDLNWLKANVPSFNADANYGRNNLPLLGISVTNIIIPQEIIDQYGTVKLEVYFAKKTPNNSIIVGNDVANNFIAAAGGTEAYINESVNNTLKDIVAVKTLRSPNTIRPTITERLKCHSIDLLQKPAIFPSFIKALYLLKYQIGAGIVNSSGGANHSGVGYVDNTIDTTVTTIGLQYKIRKIISNQYIPSNSIATIDAVDVDNRLSESGYTFKIYYPTSSTVDGIANNLFTFVGLETIGYDTGTFNIVSPLDHNTYLYSLCQYKTDVHKLYEDFEFIKVNDSTHSTDLIYSAAGTDANVTQIYGGDCFNTDYSFNAYGREYETDITDNLNQGFKVNHRYYTIARHNISFRYATYNETKYIPKFTGTIGGTTGWLSLCYRTSDPFGFNQYDLSFSKQNDFELPVLYNPYATYPVKYSSNDIIQSIQQVAQSQEENWRDFLINNRYTLNQKNGEIINIQGLTNSKLLIQNNSLYITQPIYRQITEDASNSIILGTGDIFEFPPQEIYPENFGYIGTKHKLACKLTKVGYVSIDSELGRLFIYLDGQAPKEISMQGMRNHFRDYSKFDNNVLNLGTDNPYYELGYNMEYDEKFDRLLVSKKDYRCNTNATSIIANNSHFLYTGWKWTVNLTEPVNIFNVGDRLKSSNGKYGVITYYDGVTMIIETTEDWSTGGGATSYTDLNTGSTAGFITKTNFSDVTKMKNTWYGVFGGITTIFGKSTATQLATDGIPIGTIILAIYDVDGGGFHYTIVRVDDANYFDNYSWTLSYSFISNSWTSFHDYYPDYLFKVRNNLYSFKTDSTSYNGSVQYRHNDVTKRGVYYNSLLYKCYLSLIHNMDAPNIDKLYQSLFWITRAELYTNLKVITTETFTSLSLWNNRQATGFTTLVPFTTIDNIYTENVRQRHQTWYFNQIRDYLIHTSIPTNTSFILGGTDGKELYTNQSLISTAQEFQLYKHFVDKYIVSKFEYDNALDVDAGTGTNTNYTIYLLDADYKVQKATK